MNKEFSLINGDCLEEMDKLIDRGVKVDAIITDPPYGVTQCSWDSIIPWISDIKRVYKSFQSLCSEKLTELKFPLIKTSKFSMLKNLDKKLLKHIVWCEMPNKLGRHYIPCKECEACCKKEYINKVGGYIG